MIKSLALSLLLLLALIGPGRAASVPNDGAGHTVTGFGYAYSPESSAVTAQLEGPGYCLATTGGAVVPGVTITRISYGVDSPSSVSLALTVPSSVSTGNYNLYASNISGNNADYEVAVTITAAVSYGDCDGPQPVQRGRLGRVVPPVTVTVNLSAAVTGNALAVSCSSSATASATCPASFSIPVGSASGTFYLSIGSTPGTVTVSASANGTSANATLTVNQPAYTGSTSGLSVSPSTGVGGSTSTGTVSISPRCALVRCDGQPHE